MKKTLLVIMSIFVLIAGLIVSCSSSGVDDITVLDSITSSPTSLFCWAGEKLDTSSVTVTQVILMDLQKKLPDSQ